MVLIGLSGEKSSGVNTCAQFFLKLFPNFNIIKLEKPLSEEAAKTVLKESCNKNVIIYPITSLDNLECFSQKYYFQLLYIHTPFSIRQKIHTLKYPSMTLEPNCPPLQIIKRSKSIIYNDGDLKQLELKISQFQIDFAIRPSFDKYFVSLCKIIKQRSNCIKRSVGVLVTKDQRIIGTGYNGTPSGMPNCYEGGCERCCGESVSGQGLDECFCVHAEENAILEVGIKNMKEATVYTTTFPCLMCTKLLISAKVSRVVYSEDYNQNKSEKFFRIAGIQVDLIE